MILFSDSVKPEDNKSYTTDIEPSRQYIRSKPSNRDLQSEIRLIGFSIVRIGNRLYECWGYERKHLKSKKKPSIEKDIIVLKQVKKRVGNTWVSVDETPIALRIPIPVYHSLTRYIECEAR